VIKKEAEKILKYKDLIIEIQPMWNMKAKMITLITRATGTISKSLRQYPNNIKGKHEIKEMQKTAFLGLAHVLWKVLIFKYKTYFTGEITLHVAQIVHIERLQRYNPRNMGCFRYVIVNTVHKGDKRDNNNNNKVVGVGRHR
jgi:hypothetical protein